MTDFPFDKPKQTLPDHKANGFDVVNTHSGQKRAYDDRTYEYTIKSEKPIIDVLDYCTRHVHACDLSYEQWLRENNSMENHFRTSYEFKKVGENEYFYKTISPYSD